MGDPAVAISVSKDILCRAGPYFRNCFNGPFKEAERKIISLPDVNKEYFRLFLKWAHDNAQMQQNGNYSTGGVLVSIDSAGSYGGHSDYRMQFFHQKFTSYDYHQIHLNDSHCCARYSKDKGPPTLDKGTAVDSILYPPLVLYIFADQYSVHQLRDDIITALFYNMLDWEAAPVVTPEITNFAYESLPPSSPFLRYLVYNQAYFERVSDLEKPEIDELRNHHPEFLFDLLLMQCRRTENARNPRTGAAINDRIGMANSCVFHEHRELGISNCRYRMRDSDDLYHDLIKSCRALAVDSGDTNIVDEGTEV